MTHALVCIKGPLEGKRLLIPTGEVVRVGRQEDNHLVIDNARVSRHHLELLQRGLRIYLKDLGSQNGTYLQGQKIVDKQSIAIEIKPGDEIGIGECLFRLDSSANQEKPNAIPSEPTSTGGDDEALTMKKLREVYVFAFKAISNQPTYLAFQQAMAELAGHMLQADRICLMTFDPQEKTLLPRFFLQPKMKDSQSPFEPSMMILHEILNQKKTIYSVDAGADARFREGQSIVSANIRSVVCTPLLVGSALLGALYLDTQQSKNSLSLVDREVVETIASLMVQGQDRYAI